MSVQLPTPAIALCERLYLNDTDDPGNVDDHLVLWKQPGDNHVYLKSVAGTGYILTSGGGGAAEFSQLTIDGESADAFLVQRANLDEIFRVNTTTLNSYMTGSVVLNADLSLDGHVNATDSKVLQVENALIGLNGTDGGWLAQYSLDGIDTLVRGVVYDDTNQNLSYHNVEAAHFGVLSLAALDSQATFGTIDNSTTLNVTAPTASVTLTIPDAKNDADFVMLEGEQAIAGLKTINQATTAVPIEGLLFDYFCFPLSAYYNPSNTQPSPYGNMNIMASYISNSPTNVPTISPQVRFNNLGTAGVVEFGYVPIRLRQGTYKMNVVYRIQTNHSIFEMYCAALGFSGVMDGYFAGVAINWQNFTLNVPAPGIYNMSMRQTGKNPSSSNYFMDFSTYVILVQIA